MTKVLLQCDEQCPDCILILGLAKLYNWKQPTTAVVDSCFVISLITAINCVRKQN